MGSYWLAKTNNRNWLFYNQNKVWSINSNDTWYYPFAIFDPTKIDLAKCITDGAEFEKAVRTGGIESVSAFQTIGSIMGKNVLFAPSPDLNLIWVTFQNATQKKQGLAMTGTFRNFVPIR
ncbi:MAG: hypothetical protein QF486_01665 [Candidatus Woesearchaeota archaeon]|jgi:hypothetical protein|nr:hypothetical protein [Candidatus Woesearchaeota archaeon]MDP7181080.1 hypothetical protein [Candidatus Woesearchaeota archaeon]MDP7198299.1 hypothetical protein [Candidatus Woesearchaeota archaeon]MDP7467401.1 hypothetical protein [Candidatus Woesearchaeota archaeon]MDP7647628.1 hypothetical protein [Candidatus Woesearchaeota archaeon]|tara:strand:+ start:95 stop:454 length:360 start_codon:yes stop_codon:yes gene_type:complete